MTERIEIDPEAQALPYIFYRRVKIEHSTEHINFDIPAGHDFFMYGFNFKHDDHGRNILLEVWEHGSGRACQYNPIPPRLLSTPGEAGGVIAAIEAAPCDLTGYGINFTATPRKHITKLSQFFQYQSGICLRLTGQFFDIRTWNPSYVDIALLGKLIPRASLPAWS